MNRSRYLEISQKALALLAVLFGVVTLFAGSRVLSGTNPGYVVFMPLLIYNTTMGVVYIGVGLISWRTLHRGKKGAFVVFVLNLIVLIAITIVYRSGGAVALESLRAMTLRTVVWWALFLGFWWLDRRNANLARPA